MNEYREAVAILLKPIDQRFKLLRVEAQLTAPFGVGANQFLVKPSDGDTKGFSRASTQIIGMIGATLIEVDVRVVMLVGVARSLDGACFCSSVHGAFIIPV